MYDSTKLIPDINTVSHNYACGNKIYIHDELTLENCSYLISDIHSIIESPGIDLIEFIINSPGGRVDMLLSLISCIKLAKRKNILVNTYITGEAASSASLLATFGDKRFMFEHTQHFIHFGTYYEHITKSSEIKKAAKEAQKFHDMAKKIYLDNTKIDAKRLDELMEDEYGYLTAQECKKLGFCDAII